MADTITKSVAARLPMEMYFSTITAAAELRMTVSDFLIMKIHAQDDRATLQGELAKYKDAWNQERQKKEQLQGQLGETQNQIKASEDNSKRSVNSLVNDLNKANDLIRTVQLEIEKRKKTGEGLERNIQLLQEKLKVQETYTDRMETVKKEQQEEITLWRKKAESWEKYYNDHILKMRKMRSTLAEIHNSTKRRDAISEPCWEIISEYIPK